MVFGRQPFNLSGSRNGAFSSTARTSGGSSARLTGARHNEFREPAARSPPRPVTGPVYPVGVLCVPGLGEPHERILRSPPASRKPSSAAYNRPMRETAEVTRAVEHGMMRTTDVAAFLGVTRQRGDQLTHMPGFPRPKVIAGRRMWKRTSSRRGLMSTGGVRDLGVSCTDHTSSFSCADRKDGVRVSARHTPNRSIHSLRRRRAPRHETLCPARPLGGQHGLQGMVESWG